MFERVRGIEARPVDLVRDAARLRRKSGKYQFRIDAVHRVSIHYRQGHGFSSRIRRSRCVDVRLGSKPAAVLNELVGPEAVGLLGLPRSVPVPWTGILRSDPILPILA